MRIPLLPAKLARSVLRHIHASSKDELKQRLMAFINDVNREPGRPHLALQIDDAT